MGEIGRAFLGLIAFTAAVWLLSFRKGRFPVGLIARGLAMQAVLALLLTQTPVVTNAFLWLSHGVLAIQAAATTGTTFVFGYLAGGPQPFVLTAHTPPPFLFAFQAVPVILLVGSLSAVLWHMRLLQPVIRVAGHVFRKLLGVSGPVGTFSSGSILLGSVEAPLLIKPLLPMMTRGEIFILMVNSMAIVGGSMMVVLGSIMGQRVPDAFGYILMATLIGTPMAIVVARAIIEEEEASTDANVTTMHSRHHGLVDAIAEGAMSAVRLAVTVVVLLIVFVAIFALIDRVLMLLPVPGGLTVARILSWLLTPVVWLMGFPAGDMATAASIIGTKIAANEVLAYTRVLALPPGAISGHGMMMITFALSNFANVGSVAIVIGLFSSIVPERRHDVAALGIRALAAALLTTFFTTTVVGLVAGAF